MLPQPSASALLPARRHCLLYPWGLGLSTPFSKILCPIDASIGAMDNNMTASFSASNLTASTALQGQATAKALRESIYLCTKRVLGAKEAACVKTRDAVKDPTSLVLSTKDYAASVPWVWPWRIRMASCNCKSLSSLREMGLEANSSGSSTTTSGSKPTPCQLRPCGE